MATRKLIRIQRMSAELANRIAAGEVVSRPASVVKELIENSLDAKARHIEIQIMQGGLRSIQVRDDGVGIHPDDLNLAITQHASSKLTHSDQLQCIESLGFRGEALASIAAVSRFKLISRCASADKGYEVICDYNEVKETVTPAAHPQGTTVCVDDLFYNIPARRKFLRAPNTEFLHIDESVRRLALSRFDVAWTFYHNDRLILKLPMVKQPDERLVKVLSRDFVKHAVYFDIEAVGLRLHGWLAPAAFHRSQNNWQYTYLNGRMVRDRVFTHAIRSAYEETLPPGRHFCCVLYLECGVEEVDVNVHPTKYEVQFRNVRWIHDFIHNCVKKALAETGVEEDKNVIQQPLPEERPSWPETNHDAHTKTKKNNATSASPHLSRSESAQVPRVKKETVTNPSPSPACSENTRVAPVAKSSGVAVSSPSLQLLGELKPHFILLQQQNQLIILDAFQAQRAIVLDKLLQPQSLSAQPLLFPETVLLEPKQVKVFNSLSERLNAWNFELSLLGVATLALRQAPHGMHFNLKTWVSFILKHKPNQNLDDLNLVRSLASHTTLHEYSQLNAQTAKKLWCDLSKLTAEQAKTWRTTCWTSFSTTDLQRLVQQSSVWIEHV